MKHKETETVNGTLTKQEKTNTSSKTTSDTSSGTDEVTIVYDGECPFCQQYMRLVRLRASAGNVNLIDARSQNPLVDDIKRQGFNLDHGMIVILEERYYHGSDAMQVLALLSTRKGWFNQFNYHVFRSKQASTVLYPVLRTGRNIVLRLLGRKPISSQT